MLVKDYCDFSKIRLSDKIDFNHRDILKQKWPDENTKKTWLAGDKEKLKNLRLVGLHYSTGLFTESRWNFILSNGEESKLKCDVEMTKHMLPDTPIRKVEMGLMNNKYNNLQGMRFFDENNTMIFEIGKFEKSNKVKVAEIA